MTTDKQRIAEETAKELARQVISAHYFEGDHPGPCLECQRDLYDAGHYTGEEIGGKITRTERVAALIELAILRALEHSEQGWVSVSERLPEMGVPVIWWSGEHQEVTALAESPEDFQPEHSVGYMTEFFTHWRPLPAPPVQPESAQEKKENL